MTAIMAAQVGPDRLDPAQLEALVRRSAAGATVTFTGVVRDEDEGRGVNWLEYEAHPDAAAALRAILDQFTQNHPEILAVAAAHRTGRLSVGEVAFVACLSSAHRAAGFAACAELVDTVKAELPVWKLQDFADGPAEWVNLR